MKMPKDLPKPIIDSPYKIKVKCPISMYKHFLGMQMHLALYRLFKTASKYESELDFFMILFNDIGLTLEDIKKHLPEKYEYSKRFCEEHGLV
jgi:hypothetical protein